jgi:hypothetical protein
MTNKLGMIIINPNGKEIIDWLNQYVGMVKPTTIPTRFIKGEGWNIVVTTIFDTNKYEDNIAWDIEISNTKLETLFALKWL